MGKQGRIFGPTVAGKTSCLLVCAALCLYAIDGKQLPRASPGCAAAVGFDPATLFSLIGLPPSEPLERCFLSQDGFA